MAERDFVVGKGIVADGDIVADNVGQITETTLTANTATTISSFPLANSDSAEFTVKVKQGSRYEIIKAIAIHNGTTVDLAQYGEVSIGAANPDALYWTTRTSSLPASAEGQINSVAYGNNLWVIGSRNGQIHTSTDGTTWASRTSNFGTTGIRSVAYGNTLWVAAGYQGQLRTSTDAITWTTRTSNFGTTQIKSVAYGNSLWVAGGDSGQLRTSTDAITWTTRTSNFGNTIIQSVAYGNNLWVAGGDYGNIRTSTDGTTWTTQTSNFGNKSVQSVAYANSLWVAGGYGGNIRTSTDAVTWTTRTSGFAGGYSGVIREVAYGNNLWVAAGQGNISLNETSLSISTDAITWTTRTSNFGNNQIWFVAYGNNLWVAGGDYAQIRTSPVSASLVTTPLTLSADISGSDVRLRATITDATIINAEVKVLKTVL